MTDLTVQRTLVKSPPELWSELSEVEGLARHLGEFGEIRITRAAPETTVAWEGEHASGTVEIEPSGWGTKVTLTAAVVEPEPEPAKPVAAKPVAAAKPAEPAVAKPAGAEPRELDDAAAPAPGVESQPEPGRLSDELDRIAERAQDSYWDELVHWGEQAEEPPAPNPRRGRFARFFRRRSRREPFAEAIQAECAADGDDAPASLGGPGAKPAASEAKPVTLPRARPKAAEATPPAGEPKVTVPKAAEATKPPAPKPTAAEPKAAEPKATEPKAVEPLSPEAKPSGSSSPKPVEADEPETAEPVSPAIAPEHARAVLEHALDNLGAAHHRPFSRG